MNVLDRRRPLLVAGIVLVAALAGVSLSALALPRGGGATAGPSPSSTPAVRDDPAPSAPLALATAAAPAEASMPSSVAPSMPPPPASQASTAVATPATGPRATARPTARVAPTLPVLPGLLGAVGDSYSQAFNVSPTERLDQPEHSWVVGNASGDGVVSLLERFRALGARPVVVDAATSGRKMSDASRQAGEIVAAARRLPAGTIAYVTFELGTNDLCDYPATSPGTFEAQLGAALAVLRTGLPPGSRILVLSIPDFEHFGVIAADYWAGRPARGNSCPPFLGSDARITLAAARAARSAYQATLQRQCAAIETADASSGRLHCTTNAAALSESDFVAGDLSTYDHFHPSLSGQARMASDAWRAGAWATLRLPAGTGG